jgi:predicted dehydrogenase
MAKAIRLGVVGLRNIGRNHIRRAMALEGVDVAGVCDTDRERLEAAASEFDIDRRCTRAEDLLAQEGLDGVILAVPNHLHAPLAIAAMAAGRHVLVEKPIAHRSADAREMIAARDRTGKVLMVGMNQRFDPLVAAARRRILAGEIGEVLYARAHWNRRTLGKGVAARGDWAATAELSGGGPLIDLGVHKLDLAMFLMGFPQVESVCGFCAAGVGRAAAKRRGGVYEVEDMAAGLVRFRGGSALHLEAAYFMNQAEEPPQQVAIYGSEGGFVAGRPHGHLLFRADGDANAPVKLTPQHGWAATAVEHFVQVLRGQQELSPTAEEGLIALRIVEAIYESARTARVVALGPQTPGG